MRDALPEQIRLDVSGSCRPVAANGAEAARPNFPPSDRAIEV